MDLKRLKIVLERAAKGGPGSGNIGHAGRPGIQGGSAPGFGGFGSYATGGGASEKQQVFIKTLIEESAGIPWGKLYGHTADAYKADAVLTDIDVKSSRDWKTDFAVSVAKRVREEAVGWAKNLDVSQLTSKSASQLIDHLKSGGGVTRAFGKAHGGKTPSELLDRVMGGPSQFMMVGKGKYVKPMPRASKFWADPEDFEWYLEQAGRE